MKKIITRSILASLLLSAMFAFTACKTDEQKCKEDGDISACIKWGKQALGDALKEGFKEGFKEGMQENSTGNQQAE